MSDKYITFMENYDWKRGPGQLIAFKAGWTGPVTPRCASDALRSGKARKVPKVPTVEEMAPSEIEPEKSENAE